MPFEHRIDPERRLVLVTGRGRVDLYDSLKAMVEIAADPDFRPEFRLVTDMREMEGYLSLDELWTAARMIGAIGDRLRRPQAVVVGSVLHFGLTCLVATLGRPLGVRLRPFFSVEEALAWLDGVTAPEPRRLLPLRPKREV